MKDYVKGLLIALLIILIVISSIIISWFGFVFIIKNDNYNMKSVTNENLQFYFTAEPRDAEGISGTGKSNLYLCSVASDSFELIYSSEKYNIKKFCADKDTIYFIGEYRQDGIEKYDLVKLENNSEMKLAEFDFPIFDLKLINNKLYFIFYEEISETEFDVTVYHYDLSENTVINDRQYNFERKIIVGEILSETEIYLIGRYKKSSTDIISTEVFYLISGNEITEIQYAKIMQKYEDKLYAYYRNSLFGNYDSEKNEVTILKKAVDYDFGWVSGLVINKTGKYALVYASRYDYKFSLSGDQLNKYYITIFNMETYKQAAVKCIDFRKNFYQVHSYTWVE